MIEFDVRGEVNVQSLSVSIGDVPTGATLQALRIGGRPVRLAAFYRIPCAPIAADGIAWGWVNLLWEEGGQPAKDEALHVVWLNGEGEARRALVPAEPPPGEDSTVWAKCYAELEALPQLFIDT